jgi:hypothetical protein
MGKLQRILLLTLLATPLLAQGSTSRFDLLGPSIDVRVTRDDVQLPIAQVPNLQAGDRLWLHPNLPADQSAHYLLICAFLRGSTNPPPDAWFTRIETWDKHIRSEGVFVTVPQDAQQAVLFMAPETGGDFTTLRKAVEGRPGVFVRASQDLTEAGFDLARTERYLALIRRVPPSDPEELQKRSNLLARTLALKPNPECFKQSVDTQFTCLTQSGAQTLLDDSHAQGMISALSTGPNSDFINQASTTSLAAGGLYSAYVGAIVDLVRIMGALHTAQYQYIPAIAFPEGDALNLRLNSPPSFRNPKSVLVIGLPAVKAATPPPLRSADTDATACLLKPSVTLQIEGAPLVFSTAFAHNLVLHLSTPPGAPAEPDIPLVPDAFMGGLVLQQTPIHHIEMPKPLAEASDFAHPELAPAVPPTVAATQPKPVLLSGVIQGEWGFDAFTGPTLQLQQLPGRDWHIVEDPATLVAGHTQTLTLTSSGTACVHVITARPSGNATELTIPFKPVPDHADRLALTLPLQHAAAAGDLHLAIQQYGQPTTDMISARTFAEPAHITSAELHAGDRALLLHGTNLAQVDSVKLGDLVFKPAAPAAKPADDDAKPASGDVDASPAGDLRLELPASAPIPPTHAGEHLTANVALHDGRSLTVPIYVMTPRPSITLLGKSVTPRNNAVITLPDANDLPLSERLMFTLKTSMPFPRDGQVEIQTVDGTLRTVLTLANSGGLLLQDPHTIVATLDPLRSFGPSAFGPLQVRALFPSAVVEGKEAASPATSNWVALTTLVRLPDLTQLQCPADPSAECVLTGSNLFLLQSISADPTFAASVTVPDGFTGSSIALPHTAGSTLYVHLRDDPGPIDPATLPPPPAQAAKPAGHRPATHAS